MAWGFAPSASKDSLMRIFVDTRGPDLEFDPGGTEQLRARGTGRGQDERCHACSLVALGEEVETAAAVSSTERRVTSIAGQPWLS